MNFQGKDIKVFSGNSHKLLAEDIAARIGLPVGKATVGTFSDGEIEVNIGECVRGSDVFIIQSLSSPVNDNLMELLIMIDAARRASAGRITAVVPYFGYARQDRKAKARDPISAKLVANMITTAGADRLLTMDLHAPQLQGFFDIPVDHLLGVPILARYFQAEFTDTKDLVAVSPDVGSVSRARKLAERLDIPIAIIDKRRPKANEVEIMNIIGKVKGKRCILVDDLIDTGGTIVNGARALCEVGATEVYACCTHAVLSGPAIDRLKSPIITKLVTLDTVPLTPEKKLDKIVEISVAEIFAQAIDSIFTCTSIGRLFTQHD